MHPGFSNTRPSRFAADIKATTRSPSGIVPPSKVMSFAATRTTVGEGLSVAQDFFYRTGCERGIRGQFIELLWLAAEVVDAIADEIGSGFMTPRNNR